MSEEQQQSQLKQLIAKGKLQGYLTYAEVNDHLPNDADPEQAEEIINMSDADRQRWMSKLSDSDFKKAREVLFKAALG